MVRRTALRGRRTNIQRQVDCQATFRWSITISRCLQLFQHAFTRFFLSILVVCFRFHLHCCKPVHVVETDQNFFSFMYCITLRYNCPSTSYVESIFLRFFFGVSKFICVHCCVSVVFIPCLYFSCLNHPNFNFRKNDRAKTCKKML